MKCEIKKHKNNRPRIFIAVVSHGHGELIERLNVLGSLSRNKEIVVAVKTNIPDVKLKMYCKDNNIVFLDGEYFYGFGYNNNAIFKYCLSELKMTEKDYFVVLNPDLIIDDCRILKLVNRMRSEKVCFATINLFKDSFFTSYDQSVRRFPGAIDFINSFLFKKNNTCLNREKIHKPMLVDWCAGSFMVYTVAHYMRLLGFNTRYFMYCEDIDICYRSHLIGERVRYYPDIKAQHLAHHSNRRFLSKHFFWHVKSIFVYLLTKHVSLNSKSNIQP